MAWPRTPGEYASISLCWQDIDQTNNLLHVRRSKTPAGWRSPTLNTTCLEVLAELHTRATQLGFAEPELTFARTGPR